MASKIPKPVLKFWRRDKFLASTRIRTPDIPRSRSKYSNK